MHLVHNISFIFYISLSHHSWITNKRGNLMHNTSATASYSIYSYSAVHSTDMNTNFSKPYRPIILQSPVSMVSWVLMASKLELSKSFIVLLYFNKLTKQGLSASLPVTYKHFTT